MAKRSGWYGSVPKIKFDSKLANVLLHAEAEKVLIAASKAWVDTAKQLIPVWSGMSRATLLKIAGKVGAKVSIRPTRSAVKRVGNRISEGTAKSEGDLKIKRGEYRMHYSHDVFHLAINEENDATKWGFRLKKPGPYEVQRLAGEAFRRVVETRFNRNLWLRILSRSLKVTQERLDG